jgi:hypothetical protein
MDKVKSKWGYTLKKFDLSKHDDNSSILCFTAGKKIVELINIGTKKSALNLFPKSQNTCH